MTRHHSVQDKLMFIFSAKNLTQMYRRLSFIRQYSAYQKAQGEAVKAKQKQVTEKHKQLQVVKGHKNNLLSTENWNRPPAEVEALFELLRRFVAADLDRLHKEGVRIRILGCRKRLNADLLSLVEDVETRTEGNDRFFLNIAFNYGGRDEIIRAAQKAAEDLNGDLSQLGVGDFDAYLDTAGMPDPDLVIRTSGEQRVSNFLLWQAAYAEFVFMDVLWPDFDETQLKLALEAYASRNRRFGAVQNG